MAKRDFTWLLGLNFLDGLTLLDYLGGRCGDRVGVGQQWDPKRSKRVGKKQEL